MGSRIKQALGRKLGPLPAYAWLAVAAVAIVLYRRWSGGAGRGSSALGAGTAQSASGLVGVGSPIAGGGGGGDATDQPLSPITPDNPSTFDVGGPAPIAYDPVGDSYTTSDGSGSFDTTDTISSDQPSTIGGPGEVAPPVPFGDGRVSPSGFETVQSVLKKLTGQHPVHTRKTGPASKKQGKRPAPRHTQPKVASRRGSTAKPAAKAPTHAATRSRALQPAPRVVKKKRHPEPVHTPAPAVRTSKVAATRANTRTPAAPHPVTHAVAKSPPAAKVAANHREPAPPPPPPQHVSAPPRKPSAGPRTPARPRTRSVAR